jgi:hypothetical protein
VAHRRLHADRQPPYRARARRRGRLGGRAGLGEGPPRQAARLPRRGAELDRPGNGKWAVLQPEWCSLPVRDLDELPPRRRRRRDADRPQLGSSVAAPDRGRQELHVPSARRDPLLRRTPAPRPRLPTRARTRAPAQAHPDDQVALRASRRRGRLHRAPALRSLPQRDRAGTLNGDVPPPGIRPPVPLQACIGRASPAGDTRTRRRHEAGSLDWSVRNPDLRPRQADRPRSQPLLPRLVARRAAGRLPGRDRLPRKRNRAQDQEPGCGRARRARRQSGPRDRMERDAPLPRLRRAPPAPGAPCRRASDGVRFPQRPARPVRRRSSFPRRCPATGRTARTRSTRTRAANGKLRTRRKRRP